MSSISIITPVLNESHNIEKFFKGLQGVQEIDQYLSDIIFVDGGSEDGTLSKIKETSGNYQLPVQYYSLPENVRGCRAKQMNLGAEKAGGDIYLFLHIDTVLPASGLRKISEVIKAGKAGGCFNISFYPKNFRMSVVELLDRILIFVTRNYFGDQAIFVEKKYFQSIGGYPDVALMEDLMMSDLLKKSGKQIILKEPVVTSSRRFYEKGILKQMAINTFLFNFFRLGAHPDLIYKIYEKHFKKNKVLRN